MLATVHVHPLYASIIRVLAYYAIFRHPLTAEEIALFCPDEGIPAEELLRGLEEFVAEGRLGREGEYYFLPDSGPEVVRRRLAMEERGRRMWRIARRIASLMRHVPYVEGVLISGQLCRYLADEESDIDYFIVTRPQRLWIVRTFFVAIRRLLLFNSRKYFCTNYYVTTENLEIRERSRYVANEVASIKPIHNRSMHRAFMRANRWIKEYYPNFDPDLIEYRETAPEGKGLRSFLERLIPTALALRLDQRLMESTRKYWRRKYPDQDDYFFDISVRSRCNESRAHPNNRSVEILQLYRDRLRDFGIDDD